MKRGEEGEGRETERAIQVESACCAMNEFSTQRIRKNKKQKKQNRFLMKFSFPLIVLGAGRICGKREKREKLVLPFFQAKIEKT
jgi:hypothetical protein